MVEKELRNTIITTARQMQADGLSPGRSGNVSARWYDGMLITPSGLDYASMALEDIVFLAADGSCPSGQLKPSSEWRFHLAIYNAHDEAQAVVHCHSRYATALACAREPIPAFHYMVAVAGGKDIPLADYATFGTQNLSDCVTASLANRRACLMANHGQIAFGATLPKALDLAREVENLAAQYCEVLKLGTVHILSDNEMERVIERFGGYGR